MEKDKNELNNLIIFKQSEPKTKKLSDSDIKSLFLGLVKLIKTNTIEEISKSNEMISKQNKIELSKTQMIVTIQEEEIINLNKKNENLTKKINELKQKLAELRCELLDCNK